MGENDGAEEYTIPDPQMQPGAAPGRYVQLCDAKHL